MVFKTEAELLKRAEIAEGRTFKELDINNTLSQSGKGDLGQVVEQGVFGYAPNSNPEADFKELGIELKVTPIKQNKNKTFSSKERLVLNIINYMEEYKTTFFTSSFWLKNEKLLIMFYLWEQALERGDYRIIRSLLYAFPEEDLAVIQNDWEVIVNKIKDGKAHELSEGDTNYLGACTKGASRHTVRQQPFSEELAKQRAFSLKQSYMTTLVRKYLDQDKLTSFASATELREKSLEEILEDRFAPYIGKTDEEIADSLDFTLSKSAKAKLPGLISAVLGKRGTKLGQIEEFEKANIVAKTIRLEPNGVPKEHMSFDQIDFNKWVSTSFDESQIYEKFETTKFLFVVFEYKETKRQNENRQSYLKGIKLWNMPEQDINRYVEPLWEETKRILKEGVELIPKGTKVKNNLPGTKFNNVTHIRPKAKNGQDKTELPDGQMITKQSFWLDKEYISKVVSDLKEC